MMPRQSFSLTNLVSIFLSVLLSMSCGCKKDTAEHLEPIYEHTKVYKTRADYFLFVPTWGDFSGPTTLTSSNNYIDLNKEDTVFTCRSKLLNGYVLDLPICVDDCFTDITFYELVTLNDTCYNCMSVQEFLDRVIDDDPFVEFYEDDRDLFSRRNSDDINKINEIIVSDSLDYYFKRLK